MKIFLTLITSALCAMASVAPALAGDWQLTGYEYEASELNDIQVYGNSHYGPTYGIDSFERYATPKTRSGFHRTSGDGEAFGAASEMEMGKDQEYGGLGWGPFRYFAGTAYAKLTITPVFRWEPNRIYSQENEEGVPDADDTPPKKLWYYEESNVSVARFFDNGYGAHTYENPYQDHHFSVEEVSNGLGNEAVSSQTGYNGTIDKASGSHVVIKDVDGYTVRGETRRLVATVATTSAALTSTERGESWGARCRAIYAVDIVTFDLMSRLKGDHDPTDLNTDLEGTGYYPSSSANIAAGGFVTAEHEHEADIVMQVKRRGGNFGYGTPLGDVPRDLLPRLRINNREGVEKPAESEEQDGTTNSGGIVLSDVLASRDLKTHHLEGGQVSVSLYSAQSNWNPIRMGWGEVEWRMGEAGDKQWNTRFLLSGGDYSEWVWTKIKHYDQKPLLKHTMKLTVERLEVREKNAETGEEQTTLYTTNAREAEQYNNGEDEGWGIRVIYQKDLTDAVSRFISLPGEMPDSGEGVYKGRFTVRKLAGVEIDDLRLALEDQGVFRPDY